jgi:hypothetical protein
MLPPRKRISRYFSWGVALICGCGGGDRSSGTTGSPSSEPADSLIISAPSGLQIWFNLSRSARSSAGESCLERGLAIRRQGKRIQVPLLYTRDVPVLIDDSTMRATLWTNCRPVEPYLVDLRNGRPVPERGRSPSP